MQLAPRRWIWLVLLVVAAGLGAFHGGAAAPDQDRTSTTLHGELIAFASVDDDIGVVGALESRRVVVLDITIVSATAFLVLVGGWSRRIDPVVRRSAPRVATVSVGLRAPPVPLLA